MGASNADGVGRNCDSEPISGFTAYAVKCSSCKCSKLRRDELCWVYNTSCWWPAEFVAGIMARNKDKVYDKKPQRYAKDNVTQWLIWSLSNNNKRLCTSYFVEANYWRTQSIARPFCNSRTTCWCMESWGNLRLVGYKFSHLPEKCHCTTLWNSGLLMLKKYYNKMF